MNDTIPKHAPSVPSADEFTGTMVHPTEMDGGYAQRIKKLAIKIHGEYELHYIPRDSDARWAAGHTYQEVLKICEHDQTKADQFSKNGPYAMDSEDPNKGRYLGTDAQWKAIEDDFDWVETAWIQAIGPEPKDFDSTIQDLDNSASELYNKGSGVFSDEGPYLSASSAINGWVSHASISFKDNIWNRIPGIIKRQAVVAGILAHAMDAARSTWARHRVSLKEIADKTIVALNAVKVKATDNTDAQLGIIGGIAALVAIPFSGGGTIPVATALIGGAISVYTGAKGLKTGKRHKVPLGDATVSGVLLNMASALSTAGQDATDNEDKICKGLQQMYDHVTDDHTKQDDSDIPIKELPKEVRPGKQGEKTYTSRQKFIIPRPGFIGDSNKLPDPPVST